MNTIKRELSRRNLLRYLGNSIVFLPLMRTLAETQVFGEVSSKRALFVFYPNGHVENAFHPTATGTNFVLPEITKPLAEVQKDIIMLKNMKYDTAGGGIDSAHQRGNNYCLTGCSGPVTNVSIDTYLGQKFPGALPVLRLGVEHNDNDIHNASSFSSATASGNTISQIEDNPMKAFNDLFGGQTGTPGSGPVQGLSAKLKKSLLDANIEQIKGLQTQLGTIEKDKLNMHIESIYELERRLKSAEENAASTGGQCTKTLTKTRTFTNAELSDSANFDLIADMQMEIAIQALACRATNVVFLTLSHGTSTIKFTDGRPAKTGVAHHTTSHYVRAASRDVHVANQVYMMGKLTKLIKGMGQVKEGDKSLLYNSVLMAVSEIGISETHSHNNVGLITAGQAGGYFKTGQCIDGKDYTHNNLLVTILQSMGLNESKFGNKDNGRGLIQAMKA